MALKLSDFDYSLPKERIAQEPLRNRSASRLMIIANTIEHRHFSDIIQYLNKNDVIVLNNTKVIPARLWGKKETGGKVEILLLTRKTSRQWMCLYSGKNITSGTKIFFENNIQGIITKKENYDISIEFTKPIDRLLDNLGEMPIPPYIKKKLDNNAAYNTVFAHKKGSTAAPTAGLHFTKQLLCKIQHKCVKIVYITLHVGLGTFLPVKEDDITKHVMHLEYFEINKKTADVINKRQGKLFVCGTTTLRCLETAADKRGNITAMKGFTDIFIYPPYQFKLRFDGIITNFHLPKSTLLMLVSAIAGREKIREAYKIAIEQKYRFFSFGDAMLIIT